MQAKALSWLLLQRDELTCESGRSKYLVDLKCSKAGLNGEDGGLSSASSRITISVRYIKVNVKGLLVPSWPLSQGRFRLKLARTGC